MTSQPEKQTIGIQILPNLKKLKQSGYEIWSVNRKTTWETFFFINHTQNVVKKLFPDLF